MKPSMSIVCALACASSAWSQSTQRVSVGPGGVEANYHSLRAALSAGGRHVAFETWATNLLAVDVNSDLPDIFVADLETGTLVLASASSSGLQGNLGSQRPSLSADGRFVAFDSASVSLVEGDSNGVSDVFVHDMQTGHTLRVSVDTSLVEANGPSDHAVISADGRWVAFESEATNLVEHDTNGVRDVFLHDLVTLTTLRLSVTTAGFQADGPSRAPSISADGGVVAFQSSASNLVDDDTNAAPDVFVWDRETRATRRIDVGPGGAQADLGGTHPTVAGRGRYVAFQSDATNLVPGDTNAATDIFVRDLESGALARVSADVLDLGANDASSISGTAQISADGRFVAFDSWSTNLAPDDVNGTLESFVHDLWSGTTVRAAVSSSGVPSSSAAQTWGLDASGRRVVFASSAAELVEGDTNGVWDVFVRDLGPREPSPSFCFGDGADPGHVSACPCGNTGSAGRGCASSVAPSGARLAAYGETAADDVVLVATGLPRVATCQLVQGDVTADLVLGDGVRCVGGALVVLRVRPSIAGVCAIPGLGDTQTLSALGGVTVGSGFTRHYQVVYRNPAAAFCPPGTVNTTNAWTLTW